MDAGDQTLLQARCADTRKAARESDHRRRQAERVSPRQTAGERQHRTDGDPRTRHGRPARSCRNPRRREVTRGQDARPFASGKSRCPTDGIERGGGRQTGHKVLAGDRLPGGQNAHGSRAIDQGAHGVLRCLPNRGALAGAADQERAVDHPHAFARDGLEGQTVARRDRPARHGRFGEHVL